MKPSRAVLGVLGGVAATAGANRLLASRAGALEPALPGDQHTYRWRGFDVAYAEAGDPDDRDLVLLHGIHAAASSREFERVFDRLAADYHVLAPDLPGFGRSSRPRVAYTSSLYERFVREFLSGVADRPVVVASSLTGAWAAMAAREVPVERLMLVCPTADTGPGRSWLRRLLRSPVVGTGLFNLLASKPSLRWFDRRDGYADARNVPDDVVDYQWRTAHQPGARLAPASFVGGALDPDVDLASVLRGVEVPVTLVWGRDATITSLEYGRLLARRADVRLVVFDDARLLPQDEHPEEFVGVVEQALPRAEQD